MNLTPDQCAVPGCPGRRNSDSQHFPRFRDECDLWKAAIRNPVIEGLNYQTLSTQYFVCARHFRPEDFRKTTRVLKRYSVPSLSLRSYEELNPNQRNVFYPNTDYCTVPDCTITRGEWCHPFPRNFLYCTEWKSAIKNRVINRLDYETLNQFYFVCGMHFDSNAYKLGSSLELILKDHAIPTLYLDGRQARLEERIPIFDRCAVPGCLMTRRMAHLILRGVSYRRGKRERKITGGRPIEIHPFPRDPDYCNRWKLAIQNETINWMDYETLNDYYIVCARHFEMDAYDRGPSSEIILKNNAIPTAYLNGNEEYFYQ